MPTLSTRQQNWHPRLPGWAARRGLVTTANTAVYRLARYWQKPQAGRAMAVDICARLRRQCTVALPNWVLRGRDIVIIYTRFPALCFRRNILRVKPGSRRPRQRIPYQEIFSRDEIEAATDIFDWLEPSADENYPAIDSPAQEQYDPVEQAALHDNPISIHGQAISDRLTRIAGKGPAHRNVGFRETELTSSRFSGTQQNIRGPAKKGVGAVQQQLRQSAAGAQAPFQPAGVPILSRLSPSEAGAQALEEYRLEHADLYSGARGTIARQAWRRQAAGLRSPPDWLLHRRRLSLISPLSKRDTLAVRRSMGVPGAFIQVAAPDARRFLSVAGPSGKKRTRKGSSSPNLQVNRMPEMHGTLISPDVDAKAQDYAEPFNARRRSKPLVQSETWGQLAILLPRTHEPKGLIAAVYRAGRASAAQRSQPDMRSLLEPHSVARKVPDDRGRIPGPAHPADVLTYARSAAKAAPVGRLERRIQRARMLAAAAGKPGILSVAPSVGTSQSGRSPSAQRAVPSLPRVQREPAALAEHLRESGVTKQSRSGQFIQVQAIRRIGAPAAGSTISAVSWQHSRAEQRGVPAQNQTALPLPVAARTREERSRYSAIPLRELRRSPKTLAAAIQSQLSPGEALTPPLLHPLETLLRRSLSSVRLHVSPVVQALRAEAVTLGPHIIFAPGKLDLRSPAGIALLGHELAHIGQPLAFKQLPGADLSSDEGTEQAATLQEEAIRSLLERGWPAAPRMQVRQAARSLAAIAGMPAQAFPEQAQGAPQQSEEEQGEVQLSAQRAGSQGTSAISGMSANQNASAVSEARAQRSEVSAPDIDALARRVYDTLKGWLRVERDRHQLYTR